MEASAACSLCGAIPDKTTEYYDGSGDKFPPQVSLLKSHELHYKDDLLECPKCGAFFFSYDDSALTGSGDSDGRVRTRLSVEDAAVLREILHRAGGATDDPSGLAAGLLRLPAGVRDLAAIHLQKRDRELARRLAPALVEAAAGGNRWPARFLEDFATTLEDAALVLGVLEPYARSPALNRLRAFARAAVCSICRSIHTYPPTEVRRHALPPALTALRQLGASERNDVWECPACDSLFHWWSEDGIDGGLSRVDYVYVDDVRACMRRPAAFDGRAIDSLFRGGGTGHQLAVALGMRSTEAIVPELVPRMIACLVRYHQPWLRDALCELARDPAPAAAILAAIAKLAWPSPMVESVAARARAV